MLHEDFGGTAQASQLNRRLGLTIGRVEQTEWVLQRRGLIDASATGGC